MKITTPVVTRAFALGIVFLSCAGLTLRADPTPLFLFDFDHASDNTVEGKGTLSCTATLKESKTHPAPLISKDGEGVTGKPGDFALDLRAATDMGNKGEGGVAVVSHPLIEALKSFTLTGWLKSATIPTNGARLFDCGGEKSGFILGLNDGKWGFQVNGKGWNTGALPSPPVGTWVFFAVTYDSTKTTENVVFYEAVPGGELSREARTAAAPEALVPSTADILALGNWPSGQRPFQGLLDRMAIYGSATDGTGALSADDVKSLYLSAATNN